MNKTDTVSARGANIPGGGNKTKEAYTHHMSHPTGIHAVKEGEAGRGEHEDEWEGGGCPFRQMVRDVLSAEVTSEWRLGENEGYAVWASSRRVL